MIQKIDCFLPCRDIGALAGTISDLRGSNIVNRIFLMIAEEGDCEAEVPEGCETINIDSMLSAATIRKIGERAESG